jgi:hypothetical protein
MAYSGVNLPTYSRAIHPLVIIVSSYHLYPGKQIYNINTSSHTFSKYVFHIKETDFTGADLFNRGFLWQEHKVRKSQKNPTSEKKRGFGLRLVLAISS